MVLSKLKARSAWNDRTFPAHGVATKLGPSPSVASKTVMLLQAQIKVSQNPDRRGSPRRA
jgi:hypothetical protein